MATETRVEILANALAQAAHAQGVVRVADLDFEALASAVDAVTRSPVEATMATPIDPEGDGLTPREINAANDG